MELVLPSIRRKRRLCCRCKRVFRVALFGVPIERERTRSTECTFSLLAAARSEKDGGANLRLMRGRRRELWMVRIPNTGSYAGLPRDSPCSATVRWPPRSRQATSEAFFRQDLRRHGVRGERWLSGSFPLVLCSWQLSCYFLKAALASLVTCQSCWQSNKWRESFISGE